MNVEDDPEAEDLQVEQRVRQTVTGRCLDDVLDQLAAVCPELCPAFCIGAVVLDVPFFIQSGIVIGQPASGRDLNEQTVIFVHECQVLVFDRRLIIDGLDGSITDDGPELDDIRIGFPPHLDQFRIVLGIDLVTDVHGFHCLGSASVAACQRCNLAALTEVIVLLALGDRLDRYVEHLRCSRLVDLPVTGKDLVCPVFMSDPCDHSCLNG